MPDRGVRMLGYRRNYARRQQYRRLSHARRLGLFSIGAAGLALFLVGVGAAGLGALLLVVAGILAVRTRQWWSLAARSRLGARSEDEVRRTLAPLQREGWRFRHALRWAGRRDIDSVAIAPSGMAFAIDTKTRTYEDRHVVSVREQAIWLARRRRRWCRRGALGVLCVVRARGVATVEREVLVVSVDCLVPALRTVAVDESRVCYGWISQVVGPMQCAVSIGRSRCFVVRTGGLTCVRDVIAPTRWTEPVRIPAIPRSRIDRPAPRHSFVGPKHSRMAGAGDGSTGLLGLFWAAFRRCRTGIILVGDERRCVEVNDAFAQLLGYKRGVVGRSYHEFAVKPPLSDEASYELLKGQDF